MSVVLAVFPSVIVLNVHPDYWKERIDEDTPAN